MGKHFQPIKDTVTAVIMSTVHTRESILVVVISHQGTNQKVG